MPRLIFPIMMNVLVACEFSGIVRNAFQKKGHYVISCDYLASTSKILSRSSHYVGDVMNILKNKKFEFDLMIAFPPCTYLCRSGAIWWKRQPWRLDEQKKSLEFVRFLLNFNSIKKIALENPVGIISTKIRKPDQYVSPHQFGHDYSKKTGLWLKNLPCLKPTKIMKNYKSWNQYKPWSKGYKSPGWRFRVMFHSGIANAMADQWS